MATGFTDGVAIAVAVGIGGCFGIPLPKADPCAEASDTLSQCLSVNSDTSSTETTMPSCSGQSRCTADCINNADCPTFKDAFSGKPTGLSKPFLDCLTTCASTP